MLPLEFGHFETLGQSILCEPRGFKSCCGFRAFGPQEAPAGALRTPAFQPGLLADHGIVMTRRAQ